MRRPPLPGDPSVLPPTQEFKPVCSIYSAMQLLCSLPVPEGTFCPVVTKTVAAALVFPVGQGTPCRANKPCAWGRENGPQTHPGCLWTVRLHSSVAMCVHPRTTGFLSNKMSDCCKLSLGNGLARQSRGLVVVPDLLRALFQWAQGTVVVIRTVFCRGKKALKQLQSKGHNPNRTGTGRGRRNTWFLRHCLL